MRLCGGPVGDERLQHAGDADRLEDHRVGDGAAQHGGPDALHDGAGDAEVGPAVVRRSLGGVDDLVGPEGLGQTAPGGREVGGQHRPVAPALERGDDGQPDRAAADDQAGLPGLQAGQSHGVLAHGQGLGQRGQVGVERVGHRAAGAAPGGPCARPARPGRRWSSRSAPRRSGPRMIGTEQTRVPTGRVAAVSGPCSTISAQNSWPKTQSAPASSAGTPTESISPVKWPKSASACRSDPQMPAESERTTTWPEEGTGSGTSPTTNRPPLVTAARMAEPPPRTARPPAFIATFAR